MRNFHMWLSYKQENFLLFLILDAKINGPYIAGL